MAGVISPSGVGLQRAAQEFQEGGNVLVQRLALSREVAEGDAFFHAFDGNPAEVVLTVNVFEPIAAEVAQVGPAQHTDHHVVAVRQHHAADFQPLPAKGGFPSQEILDGEEIILQLMKERAATSSAVTDERDANG